MDVAEGFWKEPSLSDSVYKISKYRRNQNEIFGQNYTSVLIRMPRKKIYTSVSATSGGHPLYIN